MVHLNQNDMNLSRLGGRGGFVFAVFKNLISSLLFQGEKKKGKLLRRKCLFAPPTSLWPVFLLL